MIYFFKRCDRRHRRVDRHQINYLSVEIQMRNDPRMEDDYLNSDRCDCDGHYSMGSVVSGKHNQSAGRRQRRADAHASPVVKSRVSNTLIEILLLAFS
jgi:hypothetical protein